MKHLVFALALLITAPAITCRAQARFKQAFINMPLASESSHGLQPMGTSLSRHEARFLGAGFFVVGFALVIIGKAVIESGDILGFRELVVGGGIIVLGGGFTFTGSIVLGIALIRKE